MAYLSELIGRIVRDTKGTPIGVLNDLLIEPDIENEPYPRVVALAVKRNAGEPTLLPWAGAEDLAGNKIILQRPPTAAYTLKGNEVYLNRDVLDKQVIDTHGFRVVRVNDLELARIGNDYRLVNVDVGGRGLLRRLGWEDISERLVGLLHRNLPARSIAWTDLGFIPRGDLQVRVARTKLKELHSADIAEILEDMRPREAGALIRDLSDEKVADVMEELEPEFQAEVLETFSDERAADIVEEMEPDAAADVLQEMEEDRREQVLNLMEPEEKEEVKELLAHPEDTAGGLMTTKYVTVPPSITVAEALKHLRETAVAREAETIYYVYVVDAEEHLLGVFSLSDLVLAQPDIHVDDIMHRRPIRMQLDTTPSDVLEAMTRYNLLALPVVDNDNRLQGIVTAEDALDLILPGEWKIKMPRLFK